MHSLIRQINVSVQNNSGKKNLNGELITQNSAVMLKRL